LFARRGGLTLHGSALAGGGHLARSVLSCFVSTMWVSLGFHDVVDRAQLALWAPGHRTVYKLEREVFLDHLAAIRSRAGARAVGRVDQVARAEPRAVCLTVDDGRVSSFQCVAPELERLGWRGHSFVTTKLIGRPG